MGLERSLKSTSGNVTDGWHSGDETPCNSTLLGRVTEMKAKDGWPGEESSSQGRNILPSGFMQSWAEPRISCVNGLCWLLVKLWSLEGPWHQGWRWSTKVGAISERWLVQCMCSSPLMDRGHVPSDGQIRGWIKTDSGLGCGTDVANNVWIFAIVQTLNCGSSDSMWLDRALTETSMWQVLLPLQLGSVDVTGMGRRPTGCSQK